MVWLPYHLLYPYKCNNKEHLELEMYCVQFSLLGFIKSCVVCEVLLKLARLHRVIGLLL